MQADGTKKLDRDCRNCGTGRFSPNTNEQQCTEWTVCEGGTVINTPTSTTDVVCDFCPAGKFTASPNIEDLSKCQDWKTCGKGEYIAEVGSPSNDVRCASWSVCIPGKYIHANGTDGTSDRVCKACPQGKFSDATNTYSCQLCHEGMYQDAKGASACKSQTDCTPGFYVTRPASITDQRLCGVCQTGRNTDTNNSWACLFESSSAVVDNILDLEESVANATEDEAAKQARVAAESLNQLSSSSSNSTEAMKEEEIKEAQEMRVTLLKVMTKSASAKPANTTRSVAEVEVLVSGLAAITDIPEQVSAEAQTIAIDFVLDLVRGNKSKTTGRSAMSLC